MGRALMVGRGATGARLPLVLPILVVLAARSCRAQKGWWQMAEITEQNRTEPNEARQHGGPRAPLNGKLAPPSFAYRSTSTALCCCRPDTRQEVVVVVVVGRKLPYMAVWARTVHTAAAAPSCGHVWRRETGRTGCEGTESVECTR